MKKYSEFYSDGSLWEKIRKFASKAGQKVIYPVLLLYYILEDKNVDLKSKVIITAALGYFIFPADIIPDLAPIIGFADDFGILMVALSRVAKNLTTEIKGKAHGRLTDWFSKADVSETVKIDKKILRKAKKE
jgi:uncharacterized membrane protein YkvA (DUF1232 family)